MKITELKINKNNQYLYEGLTPKHKKSVMLWESAGRALLEAQLTPQEIEQLFQELEKGVTGAGDNRTAIGMTKDAAAKVSAAYNDLKTKVANSGPIKNIDAMYDEAAEKLKKATGGDQGVMQYVEKYRDFAKKHPVAQSLIYGALIAAAGISGAGAGGAAALGLLKMTDKLLQGEKFSSAAYSGIKTGALAYGASKLGDLIKNTINPGTNTGDISWYSTATGQTSAHFKNGKLVGDIIYNNQNLSPNDPGYKEAYKVIMDYAKQQGMTGAAAGNVQDIAKTSMDAFKGGSSNFESRNLTRRQVLALFENIVIAEGLFDKFKTGAKAVGNFAADVGKDAVKAAGSAVAQGAGAVVKKAQTMGHNITTKVTADKLKSAWKKAGSPTDSEAIIDILTAQGIDPTVINGAMQNISQKRVDRSRLPDVTKLTLQQKRQILQQLDALDTNQSAEPAANPAPAANGPITPQSDPKAFPKVINGKAIQFQSRNYKEFKYLVDGIKARI